MIGTLGEIAFEVSAEKVKTFTDLTLTRSVAYSTHKIFGKNELLEFTGLNAQTASLKITFRADLGINPKHEIDTLHAMLDSHEAFAFTLGGQVIGRELWIIDNLSETYDIIGANGEIISASVNISLKEYLS